MHIPDRITIGDKYGPAMAITDQSQADEYFEACVQQNLRQQARANKTPDRAEAEKIERINLGYYAGYYDAETRARVERLFRCAHPIFGEITKNGSPTFDQALNAGCELAKQRLEGDARK